LGDAAADFPKLKKKGFSDEAALENFEKKVKEGNIPEKKHEALSKTPAQKPKFEEWQHNKYYREKMERSSPPYKVKAVEQASEKKHKKYLGKSSEKESPHGNDHGNNPGNAHGNDHGPSHSHGHEKGN
jgi:hypothetical protein